MWLVQRSWWMKRKQCGLLPNYFGHLLFCVTSLGAFGAVFVAGSPQISDTRLFAARPGLRLWKADTSGTVEATLMFRDQLTQLSKSATLLHDLTLENSQSTRNEDRQFGRLLLYGTSCLITYHGTCLYVLDCTQNAVVCYHGNVGPVTDVAICNDEVYVLRSFTHRPLIRLLQRPLFDSISTMKSTITAMHLLHFIHYFILSSFCLMINWLMHYLGRW